MLRLINLTFVVVLILCGFVLDISIIMDGVEKNDKNLIAVIVFHMIAKLYLITAFFRAYGK